MNEKVTINIIGNICSGKTTLIEKLKSEISNASFFSIDEYRKRFSDGSASADSNCWERMIADVARADIAIVESTGVSQHYYRLRNIPDRNTITVLIDCDADTCLRRYEARPKNGLGIGLHFTIRESLSYIERRLQVVNSHIDIDGLNDEMTVFRHFMDFIKTTPLNAFLEEVNEVSERTKSAISTLNDLASQLSGILNEDKKSESSES